MSRRTRAVAVGTAMTAAGAAAAYVGLVTGACPVDLTDYGTGTRLEYRGELAADLWRLGERWAELVARAWEHTVAASLATVKAEAERRTASR